MIPCENCTGCGACSAACPVGAIRFERNAEGFAYPVIENSKCISCGKCRKVCPGLREQNPSRQPLQVYAAAAKDENLRLCSSSGGIFSLLARAVLAQGGAVAGCAMREDMYDAEHILIQDEKDLGKLRGAKYIQSSTASVLPQIKAVLSQDRRILFCGTPCQVAGLKAYLGEAGCRNLITADMICHGVPAPEIWKQYIQHLEKQYGAKAAAVCFRSKRTGWKRYSLEISFENGKQYSGCVTGEPFLQGFVSDSFLRDSCYRCRDKGGRRCSDITLGDFWGIREHFPQWDDDKGVSAVFANTETGRDILETVLPQTQYCLSDTESVVRHNPSYHKASDKYFRKVRFFCSLRHVPAHKQLVRCYGGSTSAKIRRKLLAVRERLLPVQKDNRSLDNL